MNRPLAAYLLLERLAMEADEDEVSFAEFLRDRLDAFWDALSDADRANLQSRRGTTIDALNPTRIEERDGVIHATLRSWEPTVTPRGAVTARDDAAFIQSLKELAHRIAPTSGDPYRVGVRSNDNSYRALGVELVRH